jgi:DNA polymerase III sliding clamp (beta) subunit (PCNA family)
MTISPDLSIRSSKPYTGPALLPILALAAKFAGKGDVRLTDTGGLSIDATDGHGIWFHVDTFDAGIEASVNGKALAEAVKAGAPWSPVMDGTALVLGTRRLNGSTPDASVPDRGTATATVDAADLLHALDCACPSLDDPRYGINGVHLEVDGAVLRLVSTDGTRLHYQDLPMSGELTIPRKMVMPTATVKLATAMLRWSVKAGFKRAGLGIDAAGQMVIEALPASMSFRMEHGEFPAYRQCIPAQHKRRVRVSTADLLGAIKAVKGCATGRMHLVKFDIGTVLTMSATSVDLGTASAKIEAKVEGNTLTMGINYTLLVDALDFIGLPVVDLLIGDALSPVVIHAPGRCAVVMPVRLD